MINPQVEEIRYKHPQLKKLVDRVTTGLVLNGVFNVSEELLEGLIKRSMDGQFYPYALEDVWQDQTTKQVRMKVVPFSNRIPEEELK